MENAMILLYDLCRLCLDEPGTDNIFEPVDWSQDILTHIGLQPSTADKMPQMICTSCRDIINCSKILKEVALENHKRLLAISGSDIDPKEVFVNASASHIAIVEEVLVNEYTPHIAIIGSDQNKNKAPVEITSTHGSKKTSSKHRITFEEDDTASERKHIKHGKKRKSSSNPESSASAPKLAVRKDLFDSSSAVTSSTKSSMPRSTPGSSLHNDPEKKTTHVSTSQSQSPTNSGSDRNVKMEFEYKCETCHRSYATPKKLYLHQLSHNKKFTCPIDVCEKRFATKGDLQKHVRSHTGEKPFKCDLCDQSFTQNVSLKSHRMKLHNDAS